MKYIYFLFVFFYFPAISSEYQNLKVANFYELSEQEQASFSSDSEGLVLNFLELALSKNLEVEDINNYFNFSIMSKSIFGNNITMEQQEE
ncbi:MAG: hypothetical protein OXC37_04140, partial [Bdellovibrionaceae bacterium]|nr:hypothetical protein [Pseudobdellovibrionaceae bacterium]